MIKERYNIPIEDFNQIGFDTNLLLETISKDDWRRLFSGRTTKAMYDVDNIGQVKFSFKLKEDGSTRLLLHERQEEIKNDIGLSEKEVQKLQEGEVLAKTIDRSKHIIWLDSDTNELYKIKSKDIVVPPVIQGIELTKTDKTTLKNGGKVQKDGIELFINPNEVYGFQVNQIKQDRDKTCKNNAYSRTDQRISHFVRRDRS